MKRFVSVVILLAACAEQGSNENQIQTAGSIGGKADSVAAAPKQDSNNSYQYRGENAGVWTWFGDECSATSVGLWAGEDVWHSGGSQPVHGNNTQAYVSSFNWCTGEHYEGWGSVEGKAAIERLDSAVFSAAVTFFRTDCFEVPGTPDSDPYWTCEQQPQGSGLVTAKLVGTGDVTRSSGHNSYRAGRTHWTDRSTGSYRSAEGTLSLVKDGTLILDGVAASGELRQTNNGSHTVWR